MEMYGRQSLVAAKMSTCFVIGNGKSRRKEPVEQLIQFGDVYVCNYATVDLPSTHSIITDKDLLIHLLSEHNTKSTTVWTREKWCSSIVHETPLYPLSNRPYAPLERRELESNWGSGVHALWKAATDGNAMVVMIGFDLYSKKTNNNLYSSKPHYSKTPKDPSDWIYQIEQVFRFFPDTMFVSIQPNTWKAPETWSALDNFSIDSYRNLWSMLKDNG